MTTTESLLGVPYVGLQCSLRANDLISNASATRVEQESVYISLWRAKIGTYTDLDPIIELDAIELCRVPIAKQAS
jgi:hypothetical protein